MFAGLGVPVARGRARVPRVPARTSRRWSRRSTSAGPPPAGRRSSTTPATTSRGRWPCCAGPTCCWSTRSATASTWWPRRARSSTSATACCACRARPGCGTSWARPRCAVPPVRRGRHRRRRSTGRCACPPTSGPARAARPARAVGRPRAGRLARRPARRRRLTAPTAGLQAGRQPASARRQRPSRSRSTTAAGPSSDQVGPVQQLGGRLVAADRHPQRCGRPGRPGGRGRRRPAGRPRRRRRSTTAPKPAGQRLERGALVGWRSAGAARPTSCAGRASSPERAAWSRAHAATRLGRVGVPPVVEGERQALGLDVHPGRALGRPPSARPRRRPPATRPASGWSTRSPSRTTSRP